MSKFDEARLFKILSINRAHGGPGVSHFYDTVLAEYEPETFIGSSIGLIGVKKEETLAWGIQVGDAKTLFVSHVDTAEKWDGNLLRVNQLDPVTNTLLTNGKNVLGADCGAGVAILLHMIDHGIPGYYLFTHGEEVGGVGAKGMATHHAEFLKGFDRAVAFDRRGTGSVITHMFCGRTCSDEFADALSTMLDTDIYMVLPDPTGSYTDTAEFTDFIGECTNVSSGYQNEHGSKETLDMSYIVHLAEKVLEVDWDGLPTVRKAGEEDPAHCAGWGFKSRKKSSKTYPEVWEDIGDMDYTDLVRWVKQADPCEVALMLQDMFFEIEENVDMGYGIPKDEPATEDEDEEPVLLEFDDLRAY